VRAARELRRAKLTDPLSLGRVVKGKGHSRIRHRMNSPLRFGILNIAKPSGATSRQVVDHVVALVRPDKAGHAGTLDPLATGVLVVCVGKATRLIDWIHDLPKSYRARFLLGRQSNTDDVTGDVVMIPDAPAVSREAVESVLPRFVGRIAQAPPRYSAVHVGGNRAYELARRGEEFELPAREIEVARIEILRFEYPVLEITIDCGSGTYIRSLGRDIGQALGSGAVLSALVRTQVGPYRLEDATEPGELTSETLDRRLLPAVTAVDHLPKYSAAAADDARIRTGRPLDAAPPLDAGREIAVLDCQGELLCIADYDPVTRQLQPRCVFIA
jgi:tRNA pseudouridine55 synthase